MAMPIKRANLLQKWIIIVRSIAITVWVSAYLLVSTATRGLSRRLYDKMLRRWALALLRAVKLSYTIHNPHQIDFHAHHRYLVMSNHLSLYDIPLLFVAIPGSLRMIAKKELGKIPLFGHAIKAGEFLLIDRNDRKAAMVTLNEAKIKMASGIVPWIAPEGTRSRTGELGEFKSGGFMMAMQTGASIVPVRIQGVEHVLPAKTFHFHLGAHADIYIGKPINTEEYTAATRKQLMQDVREAILTLGAAKEKGD